MNLTDREKEQLKAMIDRGEKLPPKYRLMLFADAPEVELIWQGKTSEVTNVVLPFQSIEQIDEPRSDLVPYDMSMFSMFGMDGSSRRQSSGWTNKLIWGDNKLILSSLKNGPMRKAIEDAGGLKLVYIDPPFDVGADFSLDIEIGDETLTKEPSLIEEIAYRDTWGKGTDSFISMIYERLHLIHSLLREDGFIFIHCDWRVNSLIKVILNEVFSSSNFRNEIVRIKCNPKNYTTSSFGNIHDSIFLYSKSSASIINRVFETRDEDQLINDFPLTENDTGRNYTTVALHAKGIRRGPTGQPWRGITPPSGRHWAYIPETLEDFDSKGYIEWSSSGNPRLKRYADEDAGKVAQDIWEFKDPGDRSAIYATQKPESLLERVIISSSNEGDLVADFFCGSGTTLAVAEKLGRKWIGCDLGRFAIHTTRKRLIGVQRELKNQNKPYRSFEILNLGKYERQYFIGVDPNLPEDERRAQTIQREEHYLTLILSAYKAERVFQTPPFHGKKSGNFIVVGPIDAPVTQAQANEVVDEARKKKISKVDILGFEFEMGLVPFAQDEARQKGVSLALKYIPKDVFDRRAVERGQVKFYDVAFVEVLPKVEKLSVSVTLKDFGVFYRQDDLDALAEKLKPGGSKVTVESGQVVKVSKDKKGAISKETLTKKWTDWIDYWAVDFDYHSRKEIIRVVEDGVEREVWTGNYVFENEWQSFRTRRDRTLELTSAKHQYPQKGKFKIAVKVIDIFGNDTTKVVEVTI